MANSFSFVIITVNNYDISILIRYIIPNKFIRKCGQKKAHNIVPMNLKDVTLRKFKIWQCIQLSYTMKWGNIWKIPTDIKSDVPLSQYPFKTKKTVKLSLGFQVLSIVLK